MTFARKPYPKPPRAPLVPIPRDMAERISYGTARLSVKVKPKTVQDKRYMDAVRGLKCYRCHKPPRSQFCHADEGKGTGAKSDCRLGWPGCAQCHYDIGTARVLDKERRREWEAEAGQRTREAINRMGLWPVGLEQWPNAVAHRTP